MTGSIEHVFDIVQALCAWQGANSGYLSVAGHENQQFPQVLRKHRAQMCGIGASQEHTKSRPPRGLARVPRGCYRNPQVTELVRGEETTMGHSGSGTKADPWVLKTPPGTSEYQMYLDDAGDPPAIICQVGGTQLKYDRRAIDDLHAMLKAHGDWMPLGGTDEQKPAPEGSVEAWGRSADNPVGGWYGLKKGLRGRFAVYMPPLLEALGLAEVTHDAKNNRMRAL